MVGSGADVTLVEALSRSMVMEPVRRYADCHPGSKLCSSSTCEVLGADSFNDLRYKHRVQNWPVILQVAGVEVSFFQKQHKTACFCVAFAQQCADH